MNLLYLQMILINIYNFMKYKFQYKKINFIKKFLIKTDFL